MLMLISAGSFAQQRDMAGKERAQMIQMSSEERAVIASKRMALALDLTEAQRVEIEKLHLERAKNRETVITERRKVAKANAAKRYARMNKNLDKRMEQQKKMKQILTEEQYDKWKESTKRPARKRTGMKKKTI